MSFKVAVVGDFMTDVYWCGTADRLSPEAPIPVVKINEVKELPGGAGNVAANLAALGVNCQWFGQGGPRKNRLVVDGHQLARWDQYDECKSAMGMGRLKDSLQDFDAIVVSDYGKGSIDQYTIDYVKGHKDIVPIFVDTKRDPEVWSGVATVIFPNTKEYKQYGDQYKAFDGLVCWKRGDMGLALYTDMTARYDPKVVLSRSQARFVKSVNGAGDTVLAAFVYHYLVLKNYCNIQDVPMEWEDLLDFCNCAAAIAVENPFTYAPTLKEVEERYYGNS